MFKFDKSMIGRKVKFINELRHVTDPEFHPCVGTIGRIEKIDDAETQVMVQWPKNSTSEDDCWWALPNDLELVENSKPETPHYTDDEIFEMLKQKLDKNGVKPNSVVFKTNVHSNYPTVENAYFENTLKKAVALAYRSGYGRGQKGKSFIIGEKAKGDAQCK